MKIRFAISVVFLLFHIKSVSQNQINERDILLTVDKRGIEAGEFIRMYQKNPSPDGHADIDDFLEKFIIYKLKVADAIKEGYDTLKSFASELSGYRNQLAQEYLSDREAKDKILRQAYDRYLTEINAWHILVNCPQDASPYDTLTAWKKAMEIRERILNGEPFEQVARSSSDDRSVTLNGGNLGYFTAFQMIMPFEEAAYSLKKNVISMPVRTSYGYHIIKVTDRRPSRGKIKVAHIMKSAPPGSNDSIRVNAEKKIYEIWNMLNEGKPFAELAEKYSDHKASALQGGELDWFGVGEMINEFSEAAFAIRDTGKYSKPVRTVYGWHIIKLLDRKSPGTFEETKSYLESRINQSYLNSISRNSLVEKLKKEYKLRVNPVAYNWFVNNTDTLLIKGQKKYNRSEIPAMSLYTFADQRLSARDFAAYAEGRSSMVRTADPAVFVRNMMETIISEQILEYEDKMLESKYPEFRYLMNEFHDGILLFNVSEKKIWNRVTDDTLGLKDFYEANKQNYLSPRRINGWLCIINDPRKEKKFARACEKLYAEKISAAKLLEKFNKNDTVLVVTYKEWIAGEDKAIEGINPAKGIYKNHSEKYPSYIVVDKVIEPSPKPLDEVKAEMISGYQDWLEAEWIKQLKSEYPVSIDQKLFEKIKEEVRHE